MLEHAPRQEWRGGGAVSYTHLDVYKRQLLVSVAAIQEPLTQQSLLRGLLMVIAGAIGGVIGVNKKSKRR